jgi:hypothetical protein
MALIVSNETGATNKCNGARVDSPQPGVKQARVSRVKRSHGKGPHLTRVEDVLELAIVLTLRLFKSEQPSRVGSPTIAGIGIAVRRHVQRCRANDDFIIDTTPLAGMKRLAILGHHLPRHRGIATFTMHLADALATASPDVDSFVLAMNDAGRRHTYPSRVRFEIAEGDLGSYRGGGFPERQSRRCGSARYSGAAMRRNT